MAMDVCRTWRRREGGGEEEAVRRRSGVEKNRKLVKRERERGIGVGWIEQISNEDEMQEMKLQKGRKPAVIARILQTKILVRAIVSLVAMIAVTILLLGVGAMRHNLESRQLYLNTHQTNGACALGTRNVLNPGGTGKGGRGKGVHIAITPVWQTGQLRFLGRIRSEVASQHHNDNLETQTIDYHAIVIAGTSDKELCDAVDAFMGDYTTLPSPVCSMVVCAKHGERFSWDKLFEGIVGNFSPQIIKHSTMSMWWPEYSAGETTSLANMEEKLWNLSSTDFLMRDLSVPFQSKAPTLSDTSHKEDDDVDLSGDISFSMMFSTDPISGFPEASGHGAVRSMMWKARLHHRGPGSGATECRLKDSNLSRVWCRITYFLSKHVPLTGEGVGPGVVADGTSLSCSLWEYWASKILKGIKGTTYMNSLEVFNDFSAVPASNFGDLSCSLFIEQKRWDEYGIYNNIGYYNRKGASPPGRRKISSLPADKRFSNFFPRRASILVLCEVLPLNEQGGFIRLRQIVEFLALNGHDVTLLSRQIPKDGWELNAFREWAAKLGVQWVGVDTYDDEGLYSEALKTRASFVIVHLWLWRHWGNEKKLDTMTPIHSLAVVGREVSKRMRTKYVHSESEPTLLVVTDDIHYRRCLQTVDSTMHGSSAAICDGYVRQLEEHSLSTADRIITITDKDANIIVDTFNIERSKVFVLPFSAHFVEPSLGPLSKRDAIIFAGSGHDSNAAGIEWFLNDVLPSLSECMDTDVTVLLMGSNRWRRMANRFLGSRKMLSPRVKIETPGYLREFSSILDRARVMIVPTIVSGTGISTKLFAAIGAGIPAVSTQEGTSGLAGWTEDAIASTTTLANSTGTADDFAHLVCLLMQDNKAWLRARSATLNLRDKHNRKEWVRSGAFIQELVW